jgi:hypothetical protein
LNHVGGVMVSLLAPSAVDHFGSISDIKTITTKENLKFYKWRSIFKRKNKNQN